MSKVKEFVKKSFNREFLKDKPKKYFEDTFDRKLFVKIGIDQVFEEITGKKWIEPKKEKNDPEPRKSDIKS